MADVVVHYGDQDVTLPAGVNEEDLWHPRVARGGYDPIQCQWRDSAGKWATKDRVMAERGPPVDRYGGLVLGTPIPTPYSDAWSQFEAALGGITTNELLKLSKGLKAKADDLPYRIKQEMQRSEHFFWQEGDLAQSFYVPMELTLQHVYAVSDDVEIAALLNDAFGDDIGCDLRWHLSEIDLCAAVFGQSFPLEIWDDKGEKPVPENIIPLYPPDVWVGQRTSRVNFNLSLPPPGGEWTEEDKKQLQAIEVCLQPKWSEAYQAGNNIRIKPELCRPVRWHSLSFQRYAHPPIASMFRPITTRVLVEEARRATIEGFRHQLWLVQVGDVERRGTPGEIAHMRTELGKLQGQRVSTLLWNGNAFIETIAPKPLDAMMDDTLWLSITLDIMRRRGISLSLISGESPAKGAGRGDVDIDIRMLLMRLGWRRYWLMRWAKGLMRRVMEADAGNFWQRRAARKAKTTLRMEPTPEEVARIIEEQMEPLIGIGQVSTHTVLRAANLDWESELRYKQLEEPHSHLFTPPVTFKQQAMLPGGETSETASPRRSQEQTERNELEKQIKAAVFGQEQDGEDTRAQKLYRAWLAFMWSLAVLGAEEAVAELREEVARRMMEAAALGYERVGGVGEVEDAWIQRGISRILGYAPGLEMDWELMSETRKRWRLGLYAQEGMRIGYVLGAQQGAREVHGADFWQRILRPERSATGPCVACQEDSFHLHSINEPFFEYHPNGVCTAQALAFFRVDTGEPALVEVDIPIEGDVWG